MTTDPETRAGFVAGLLDLACFLEAHPDVPVPQHGTRILPCTDDGSGDTRRAVDEFAALTGVAVDDTWEARGHYHATRAFGTVEYHVYTVSNEAMARHHAESSYHGCVQPGGLGEVA